MRRANPPITVTTVWRISERIRTSQGHLHTRANINMNIAAYPVSFQNERFSIWKICLPHQRAANENLIIIIYSVVIVVNSSRHITPQFASHRATAGIKVIKLAMGETSKLALLQRRAIPGDGLHRPKTLQLKSYSNPMCTNKCTKRDPMWKAPKDSETE